MRPGGFEPPTRGLEGRAIGFDVELIEVAQRPMNTGIAADRASAPRMAA